MDPDYAVIAAHLVGAVLAGGAIGLERSFHGRPAGFRTHTLVCLASSLLMLLTYYQLKWLPAELSDSMRADPTRVAQGIMTGIGFLGAGVIFREGLTVRGLTTAASIWVTAAIGILIGVGFYFPAFLATVLTLGALSLFRVIELRLPSQSYAHHYVRFARSDVMPEEELKGMLAAHGFSVANMSYRITDDDLFEYRMVMRTLDPANASRLAEVLRLHPSVREFRISPTGDTQL
jgi:putative Mg2+ transporter-C (MgtC) family protein